MSCPRAVVVVPTLTGGDKLTRCLEALAKQTCSDFEVFVVDNSGRGAARPSIASARVRVIENPANYGFGRAVNQAAEASESEFICTLNDDAYPEPGWLEALIETCSADPRVGMCASRILLGDEKNRLDSTGLDIYGDGTTKQRGHGSPAEAFSRASDALVPSGCAALYRRSLFEQLGGFDEDYFLYAEDADLGLRARRAGWLCRYAPQAAVVHDYSRSAGRASPLKAFYVERNRLFTVAKVFPTPWWPLVPFYSLWRYIAHLSALAGGRGLVSEFGGREASPARLVLIVGSAHWHALRCLPALLRKRRLARESFILTDREFWKLLRRHYCSARTVASQ